MKKLILPEGGFRTTVERKVGQEIARIFSASPDDVEAKLENFPKYIRRQKVTRFISLYEIFKKILPVKGSIIECGVYRGFGLMTWANLSAVLEPNNLTRRIYGFDTFEGLNSVSELDKSVDKKIFDGKTEDEIEIILEDAIGDTGKLDVKDVSIVVADYYNYSYFWRPKKLCFDVLDCKGKIIKKFNFPQITSQQESKSYSADELVSKISELTKADETKIDPSNIAIESLYFYSTLLYYLMPEPQLYVINNSKNRVEVWYE